MSVIAIEATIEDGQIRLPNHLNLPEHTKVYIIIPDLRVDQVSHIYSPHLKYREQAADFVLEVGEESPDA